VPGGTWKRQAILFPIALGVMLVWLGQYSTAAEADGILLLLFMLTAAMVAMVALFVVQYLRGNLGPPPPVNPFSDEVVGALFLARQEAEHSRQPTITDVHVLRGLLRTRGCVAEIALTRMGVALESLPEPAPQPPAYRAGGPPGDTVPLSLNAQLCLRAARDEAQAMGHLQVRTGHILLALLRDDVTGLAPLLRDAGLDRPGVVAVMAATAA
jgi:hypothetical protein